MDNLMTYANLRRDNYTKEVCLKGRWYTEEEYFELREDIEHDESHRDKEAEERAEARAEMEREESWAA